MLSSLRSVLSLSRLVPLRPNTRFFTITAANMVKAGDKIPNVELYESSPGDKVNLSKELTGKGLIIGVPAAFSKSNFSSCFFDLEYIWSQQTQADRAVKAPLAPLLIFQATLEATSSRMPAKSSSSLSMMHSCKFPSTMAELLNPRRQLPTLSLV